MGKSKNKTSGFPLKSRGFNNNSTQDRNQILKKEKKALELFHQGKFKDSENLYREIISNGSRNYVAYANLAQLCAMQGQTNETVELLKKALELNPSYASGYFNLANFLSVKPIDLADKRIFLFKSLFLIIFSKFIINSTSSINQGS